MEKLRSLYNTLAVVEVKPSDWLNIRTSLLLFRCPFGSNCLFAPPPPLPQNCYVTTNMSTVVWSKLWSLTAVMKWRRWWDHLWMSSFLFSVCVYVCALWPVRSVVMGVGWGRERGVGKKKKKKWEGVGAGGWGGSGTKSLFGLFCFSLCTFFIGKIC